MFQGNHSVHLKHFYDVAHCSFRTIFHRLYCTDKGFLPKKLQMGRLIWTVSKTCGQLANTTQTVVIL